MPIAAGTYYVYTVRPGDSLYSIADQFDISVPYIVNDNALYPPFTDPDLIYPGQVLLVRTPGMSEASSLFVHAAPGDTLYAIAQRFSTSIDLLMGMNPQINNPNLLFVHQNVYVPAFVYEIREGDTLSNIAKRFEIPLMLLIQANQGRPYLSADLIMPGFHLIVPLQTTRNMVVFHPIPGTLLTPEDFITGFARAFEGAILYQIRDAGGQTVTGEKPIQTSAGAPAYGSFQHQIVFDQAPTTASGQLWVYSRSARDGSIQDLIEIGIIFQR